MNEMLATASAATPEGQIRRYAAELSGINSELELELNRMRSIEVRLFPSDRPDRLEPAADRPPEPVRTDLEELQHQINRNRDLVRGINELNNVLVEL